MWQGASALVRAVMLTRGELPQGDQGYGGIPSIASEAKQSSFLRETRKLDCFVASLLAMTVGSASRPHFPYVSRIFAWILAMPEIQRS